MDETDDRANRSSTRHGLRRLGLRWVRRFVVIVAMYGVMAWALSCSPMIDRLTLFPTTHVIQTTADRRVLNWGEGKSIEVWVARSRGGEVRESKARDDSDRDDAATEPAGFVLVFSGNASRAERVIDEKCWEWRGHDVEVWAVNYPGYGRSEGPARLKSLAHSSLSVYDQLRAIAGNRPIVLDGSSMGTTAALHVSANREDVAGLVLLNPPALRQIIRGEFGWWNLWLIAGPMSLAVPHELDSLSNAKRSKSPALFVTSGRDRVVPYAYQQRVLKAHAGPTKVIHRTSADHNDPLTDDELDQLEIGMKWLMD